MAVTADVQVGNRPYNLTWRINITDSVRQHESDVFSLENTHWCLVLQIEHNPHHRDEDWKIYLRNIQSTKVGFCTFLTAVYIVDKKKKLECLNFTRITVDQLASEQIMWRRKSNVLSKYPDVVMEGNVMLLITMLPESRNMENCTEEKCIQTPSYLAIQPCLESLTMDFRTLQVDGTATDIEVQCGERILKAHRSILIARSDVFSAMLQDDMLEKKRGSFEIADVQYHILEHFIRYLYTGSLPDLTIDLASRLYEVGDKYAVASLRNRCANFLKEHITDENAFSLLVLADTHSDEILKDYAISYIIQKDILMTMYDEETFRVCHPKLAVDVLYRAYQKAKRSTK